MFSRYYKTKLESRVLFWAIPRQRWPGCFSFEMKQDIPLLVYYELRSRVDLIVKFSMDFVYKDPQVLRIRRKFDLHDFLSYFLATAFFFLAASFLLFRLEDSGVLLAVIFASFALFMLGTNFIAKVIVWFKADKFLKQKLYCVKIKKPI